MVKEEAQNKSERLPEERNNIHEFLTEEEDEGIKEEEIMYVHDIVITFLVLFFILFSSKYSCSLEDSLLFLHLVVGWQPTNKVFTLHFTILACFFRKRMKLRYDRRMKPNKLTSR